MWKPQIHNLMYCNNFHRALSLLFLKKHIDKHAQNVGLEKDSTGVRTSFRSVRWEELAAVPLHISHNRLTRKYFPQWTSSSFYSVSCSDICYVINTLLLCSVIIKKPLFPSGWKIRPSNPGRGERFQSYPVLPDRLWAPSSSYIIGTWIPPRW